MTDPLHSARSPSASAAAAPQGAPGPATERVLQLDVLRGFALYGVLLANTVIWYSGLAFLPRTDPAARESTIDIIANFLLGVLVHGKAMSLLSFLFGLGFAMQLQRAEARGQSVTPMYLRRLAAMFAIGVAHMIFIWWGDILRSYAMAGVALLLFRRCRDRTLLLWAAALTLLPQLATVHPSYPLVIDRVIPGTADRAAFKTELLAAMRGDDYLQLMKMQTLHSVRFLAMVAVPSLPWTVGRFLLGYVVGRRRWLYDAERHLPLFRRVLGWGLGLGIAGSLVRPVRRLVLGRGAPTAPMTTIALELPVEVGALGMTAAYVAAIVLLMQRPVWARRLLAIAPVGQMPLTNYLSQSVICTFLFYGWGLGLMGRVGAASCIPITLAIFVVQAASSRAWMKRYRFGPVEWVWRSLAYAQLPPMRRVA